MRCLVPLILSTLLAACGVSAPDSQTVDTSEAGVAVAPASPGVTATTPFVPDDPALIRAEIVDERTVTVIDPSLTDASAVPVFTVARHDGASVPVAGAVLVRAGIVSLTLAEAIDRRVVHDVTWPDGRRERARFDGWFRDLHSDRPLGLNVAEDGSHTTVGIFAPRADAVTLFLYDRADATPDEAVEVVELAADADGVFHARLEGDRHGQWYDLRVTGPGGPGSRFFDTHPVHVSEPYARVYDERHAKARIWRDGPPPRPVRGGRPAKEDVIAYEVHVQDFTDLSPVQAELGSSFDAFVTPGLTNSAGEPIGIDHLVDLGVNVVHLLPVQEFLHEDDDLWQSWYAGDPVMEELGVAEENYQWGYRTTHFFALEGRFRRKGTSPGEERAQFRELVQAFHDRGIAVIIDMVPNHTGENMNPDREELINFNPLCRFDCYRLGTEGEHIGVFGNEVKTEDRPMMRRWLIDQALHFMEVFGVDGYRIDLAGQIDEQSMIALVEALPEDAIIYGEPWIDTNDLYVRANPDWDWYKEDAPITFFQDDTRDALVGSPFVLENPATDLGYAGGNTSLRDRAMNAIVNGWESEAFSTNQGINYADIHDNWTLADRFALMDWDGRQGVNEAGYRLAAGMLLTSLGPVVLHGGSEFMRSKGIAPLHETFHETVNGTVFHIKGREDTYNIRTPNQFDWELLGTTSPAGDHGAMNAWWRGLIALRRSDHGKVFRTARQPAQVEVTWFTPQNAALLGYMLEGRVLVLVNVGREEGGFDDVALPAGLWRQVADGMRADPDASFATMEGGAPMAIAVPGQSLHIWVRE